MAAQFGGGDFLSKFQFRHAIIEYNGSGIGLLSLPVMGRSVLGDGVFGRDRYQPCLQNGCHRGLHQTHYNNPVEVTK